MRIPEVLLPLVRIWRHRNYACFMGGMTPSLVTLWMQKIGTGWLAWELTQSNAWVGAIVAADYAPMLILAPFVGAYIDRADPVKIQTRAQWVCLVQSAAVAGLTFSGAMTIELLFVLCFVLGCNNPFSAIARHSIVPATVPRADIATALAVDSALFNAARFIGPALAGVLIWLYGVGITFAIHCLGCVCYLVGIYAMRLPQPVAKPPRHGDLVAGMLGDIVHGVSYVRGHAGIGPLFLLMGIGAVCIRPLQDLLPGFAAQVFRSGPSGLGLLTAGMGVGATVSAALIAMHGRVGGLTLAIILCFLVNLLATLGFVATGSLWIATLMGVVWGFTLTLMSTGTQALVQSAVDNDVRARVMSLYTMIYRGAPFIGALVIGVAADTIGLRLAFVFAVVLCVLPGLMAMQRRDVIAVALEGRSNDLDQRLWAVIDAWAGVQYERWVDLRAQVRSSALAAKLQALLQRRP